jgi:hypothetical protein
MLGVHKRLHQPIELRSIGPVKRDVKLIKTACGDRAWALYKCAATGWMSTKEAVGHCNSNRQRCPIWHVRLYLKARLSPV